MKVSICLIVTLSVIKITVAGHNPNMNVDFGINLPSMSFKLPGMSMPKMRITAIVNKSKPKKPMKIELPAISLHAKSLEDPWGQSGGSDSYSGGGAAGYGGSSGGGGSDGWSDGGSDNGYASENDEEYSEGHSEEDDDSYEAPQSGYRANNNNNKYNQETHQGYGQGPTQQIGYSSPSNVQSGYNQNTQYNAYPQQINSYNQHQPQGYNQQQSYGSQPELEYNQQPQYNQNQEYNHQVLKYGPPRPDQDYGNQGANYPQPQADYGTANPAGYDNNQASYGGQVGYNQGSYGSNGAIYGGYGHNNYGPNHAEHKELYVHGKTPEKVHFYEDKYPPVYNAQYQQNYGRSNNAEYAANSPTSVTLSTGYKSQSTNQQSAY